MYFGTQWSVARVVGLVLAVSVGITACGGGRARPEGGTTEAATTDPATVAPSPTTEPPASRDYTAADLEAIVHPADDPPQGTEHVETAQGEEAAIAPIEDFASAEDKQGVAQGLEDARANLFVDPDLARFVGSWAALYEEADAASAAMDLVVGSVAGYLELEPQDAPFGEEGVLVQGSVPAKDDDPERSVTVYVWRIGNLVLMANATSFGEAQPYDEAAIRAIAEGMAERAA